MGRFSHRYATRHLQDGIDIRTLQQWMGRRDLASTMVYLKGARNRDVQARINTGSLGVGFVLSVDPDVVGADASLAVE